MGGIGKEGVGREEKGAGMSWNVTKRNEMGGQGIQYYDKQKEEG